MPSRSRSCKSAISTSLIGDAVRIEIEDLLQELLRFDRATPNKVKVDKMTRVVANTITAMQNETPRDVIRTLMDMDTEGHA